MDPHRLAEERSIAYHRLIAARLREDPQLLESARNRVSDWLNRPEGSPLHAQKWKQVLDGDIASITAFLTERSEPAAELRQSTPFAGALAPRERWRIWREIGDRLGAQP